MNIDLILINCSGQLGQIGIGAWRFVSDLKRDPYSATMTAFSKISDYLRTRNLN